MRLCKMSVGICIVIQVRLHVHVSRDVFPAYDIQTAGLLGTLNSLQLTVFLRLYMYI